MNVLTTAYLENEQTIVENILRARGIDDFETFLNPKLVDWFLPFESIPNLKEAAEEVVNNIDNTGTFFLSVDSDTDGITSGTIMYRWLWHHYRQKQHFFEDSPIKWYVSQGKSHGTSERLIEQIEEMKPDILIVMDSLDSNCENYQRIRDLGTKIIVLDHHDIRDGIPYDDVVTLVSSNRSDNKALSGAGVVWKFCLYLDYLMGENDYTLNNYTDLAAVGLIADMMDMSATSMENRAIVNYGLEHMQSMAIKKIIGSYKFNANSIVFSIAPLINAACRYFENNEAFRAFIEDADDKRRMSINCLKRCKKAQKSDIEYIKENIVDQIESQIDNPFFFLVINTEYGIAGLIANQLMAQYHKPTFVVVKRNNQYQGSGRSNGVDLRKISHDIVPSAKAYGHPQAFGFFLDQDYLKEFSEQLSEKLADVPVIASDVIDCEIDTDSITHELIDLVHEIDRITGQEFRPVKFMVETDGLELSVSNSGKHLKFLDSNGFLFVKWNAAEEINNLNDFDESKKVRLIGSLDKGFLDKSYNLRMVVDKYEVLD